MIAFVKVLATNALILSCGLVAVGYAAMPHQLIAGNNGLIVGGEGQACNGSTPKQCPGTGCPTTEQVDRCDLKTGATGKCLVPGGVGGTYCQAANCTPTKFQLCNP